MAEVDSAHQVLRDLLLETGWSEADANELSFCADASWDARGLCRKAWLENKDPSIRQLLVDVLGYEHVDYTVGIDPGREDALIAELRAMMTETNARLFGLPETMMSNFLRDAAWPQRVGVGQSNMSGNSGYEPFPEDK